MKDEYHEALLAGGGPAFPVTWQEDDGQHVAVGGMTLLDWFAGQALPAVITEGVNTSSAPDGAVAETWRRLIAEKSYAIAFAMLEARKR